MHKIIKGKSYDSDTTEQLGWWSNYLPVGDFDAVTECLHRKKTGEFFLWGMGGARTPYAHRDCLGGWCSGEEIVPITESEAREWAEEHLDGDRYEAIFGEVSE